jgi:hypothetical protein
MALTHSFLPARLQVDAPDGASPYVLPGHQGEVTAVAWCPSDFQQARFQLLWLPAVNLRLMLIRQCACSASATRKSTACDSHSRIASLPPCR